MVWVTLFLYYFHGVAAAAHHIDAGGLARERHAARSAHYEGAAGGEHLDGGTGHTHGGAVVLEDHAALGERPDAQFSGIDEGEAAYSGPLVFGTGPGAGDEQRALAEGDPGLLTEHVAGGGAVGEGDEQRASVGESQCLARERHQAK